MPVYPLGDGKTWILVKGGAACSHVEIIKMKGLRVIFLDQYEESLDDFSDESLEKARLAVESRLGHKLPEDPNRKFPPFVIRDDKGEIGGG